MGLIVQRFLTFFVQKNTGPHKIILIKNFINNYLDGGVGLPVSTSGFFCTPYNCTKTLTRYYTTLLKIGRAQKLAFFGAQKAWYVYPCYFIVRSTKLKSKI